MNNKLYVLSPKELILCCAALGINELRGVENAWADANEATFAREAGEILEGLEAKKLAEMDFSGGYSVDESFADTLKRCAAADRTVVADVKQGEGERKRYIVCADGSDAVLLELEGDSYTVSQADEGARSVADELCGVVSCAGDVPAGEQGSVSVPSSALEAARRSADAGALEGIGCPQSTAKIVCDKSAVYLSMLSLSGETSGYLAAIIADEGAVRMEMEYTLEDEQVRLTRMTGAELKKAVSDMLSGLFAR